MNDKAMNEDGARGTQPPGFNIPPLKAIVFAVKTSTRIIKD